MSELNLAFKVSDCNSDKIEKVTGSGVLRLFCSLYLIMPQSDERLIMLFTESGISSPKNSMSSILPIKCVLFSSRKKAISSVFV